MYRGCRSRQPLGVDGVAQRHVDEGAVGADVAHARETRVQGAASVANPGHRLLGAGAGQQLGVPVTAVLLTHQVRMTVHQSRQHGVVREVADGYAGRHVVGSHDVDEVFAVDEQAPIRQQLPGRDVQQPSGAERVEGHAQEPTPEPHRRDKPARGS